ncbi:hypothetical protein BpHYR1_013572 [Brachionus plicatilis]|uniref:Uncharacterized protein n=1 Tax=Brachionus plicatilis TaxID=10195 RepID=A0A3M7Q9P9_BRAPC|nr:hypothetical protein BpHYR1_013572 [Brachionus plicatilis]
MFKQLCLVRKYVSAKTLQSLPHVSHILLTLSVVFCRLLLGPGTDSSTSNIKFSSDQMVEFEDFLEFWQEHLFFCCYVSANPIKYKINH